MRGRKLRGVVGLALVALLAAWAFADWPRPNRIPQELILRIEEEMSRAEVEAIPGGPPNGYGADDWLVPGGGGYGWELEISVLVYFDKSDRVKLAGWALLDADFLGELLWLARRQKL